MVRKAKISDVEQLVKLVAFYAEKGEMLPRSPTQVFNSIRDYVVVEKEGKIIGCGALHVIWDDIAEIRTLAVDQAHLGKGIGREIVNYLIEDAYSLGLPKVFALTYKAGFFEKLGFSQIEKGKLSHKVWQDCWHCPKFPLCDEVAVIRNLDES